MTNNKRRRRRGHRMDPARNIGHPAKAPTMWPAHGWVPTDKRRVVR